MQSHKLNFIGKKPDEKTIEEIGKLIYAYERLQDMQKRFHPSHAYYYHHSLAQIATVEKRTFLLISTTNPLSKFFHLITMYLLKILLQNLNILLKNLFNHQH